VGHPRSRGRFHGKASLIRPFSNESSRGGIGFFGPSKKMAGGIGRKKPFCPCKRKDNEGKEDQANVHLNYRLRKASHHTGTLPEKGGKGGKICKCKKIITEEHLSTAN